MQSDQVYPITQLKGRHLSLSWDDESGDVEIALNGELLFEGSVSLTEPVKIPVEGQLFEEIRLVFDRKTKVFDVIVDGLHSPVNRSHPVKSFRRFGYYFLLLAAASWYTASQDLHFMLSYQFPAMIAASVLTVLYVMIAWGVARESLVAYWLGYGLFVLTFLLYICLNDRTGIPHDSDMLIRGILAAIGAYGLRLPFELQRYKIHRSAENEDLLDD